MPEVFCFELPPSAVLFLEETEAFKCGLTGLSGARQVAYWDERIGRWQRFGITDGLRVDRSCPVLLLRREDAFYLRGLGDALQFLHRGRLELKTPAGELTRCASNREVTTHRVRRTRSVLPSMSLTGEESRSMPRRVAVLHWRPQSNGDAVLPSSSLMTQPSLPDCSKLHVAEA